MDDDFRAEFVTFRAGNVERAGQVIHHRVHQDLHTFFLEGRTAENRNQFDLAGEAADGGFERGRVNTLFFEHHLCDGIVLVGDGINQFRERSLRALLKFGGNVFDFVIQPFIGLGWPPEDYLLVDHVNHALKAASNGLAFGFSRTFAEGQENRDGIRAQLGAHVIQRVRKICASAVHLVHERDARNFVFGRLSPDCFRLWLDAGNTTEDSDRAVQHAHGTLNFGGEIHVTRRINDVDAMRHVLERLVNLVFTRLGAFLRPEAGHSGGGNGDATLLFLLHPVGDRVAVIYVTDLMNETSVK